MRPLTERQMEALSIVADETYGIAPGRLAFRLNDRRAGKRRPSISARNTLGALERRGLVWAEYPFGYAAGSRWHVTQEGREVLEGR